MNIAIDMRLIGRQRTGDEIVFRNLTRALLSIDKENRYLLLTDRGDEMTRSAILEAVDGKGKENCEVVALPASENRFLWNLVALPLFLLKNNVDIFHTQYILPAYIPKRTRVVAHIHDVSFRVFPELILWKDRFFLSLLIPHTMRRANLLVVPSRFTREEIIKYYRVSEAKIVVVPNAISPEFFEPVDEHRLQEIRKRYSLPETFILSVGTFQPRKNLSLLIRAFGLLRKRLPEMRLVLVGNRSGHHYDTTIDRAIAETNVGNQIVFPGFIASEDLPGVYRLARMLVFPSRYEGFGIPLLEAFSQNVPVAAADIPPFREVGGDAACFFPTNGVEDLAEMLYTLCTDDTVRNRFIEGGRDRVSGYSWNESARVLLLRYHGLVRNL